MQFGPIAPPVVVEAPTPQLRPEAPEPVLRSTVLAPLQPPDASESVRPLVNSPPSTDSPDKRQTRSSVDKGSKGGESEPPNIIDPPDNGDENQEKETGVNKSSNQGITNDREDRTQQQVEQQQVKKLASRDREVRAHEQAHSSVGGQYAGAPTYSFTRGPDGRQYATGGEVSIDAAPVPGDPEATIRKAQIVRRAALAPAEPSAQDRLVAAQATQMEIQARAELAAQKRAEQAEENREKNERKEAGSERFGIEAYEDLIRISLILKPGQKSTIDTII